MLQTRQHPSFPLEACGALGIVRHIRRQYLERNVAVELGVMSEIDLTHPAFAEQAGDFVMGDGFADQWDLVCREFVLDG